jgi:geranylgeranyl pyrophosphate synthase
MRNRAINNLIELYGQLYKEHVEPFIHENFPQGVSIEPVYYYLDRETIRFRSGLPILINQMFGGELKNVLPISASSEIIYAITLLQDDIIDNDEVRWGLPSGWKKYGIGSVIVSADFSYYYVIDILRKIPESLTNRGKIIESFLNSHKKLYSSFIIENNNKRNFNFGIQNVLRVYEFKTITGINATYCGTLSVDSLPRELYENVKEYATYLAYAAQIRDDIKDLELYKKEVSDIRNGYMTYPIVKLKNVLNNADKEIFRSNFGVDSEDSANKILSLLEKYDIKSKCIDDANHFVDYALSKVDIIKKYDKNKVLETWAEFYRIF